MSESRSASAYLPTLARQVWTSITGNIFYCTSFPEGAEDKAADIKTNSARTSIWPFSVLVWQKGSLKGRMATAGRGRVGGKTDPLQGMHLHTQSLS